MNYDTFRFRAPDGKLRGLNNLWPETKREFVAYVSDALAGIHRFNGYGGPYSVAQHCVLCEDLLPAGASKELRALTLLHDATEAVMGDLPKPWKSIIPEFAQLEARIYTDLLTHNPVVRHLGAEARKPEVQKLVGEVDALAMKLEAKRLFGPVWRTQFGFPLDEKIHLDGDCAFVQNSDWHAETWEKARAFSVLNDRLTKVL